jgi:hypothetical protein
MILRGDWLPLFFGTYNIAKNALKLLPSACRLLSVPEDAMANRTLQGTPILNYNGKPITRITGGGGTVKTDSSGVLYVDTTNQTTTARGPAAVTTLNINGVEVTGEDITILSTGNGLGVTATGNVITIGN